jgi:asparagine synthetase B (glutamine-hydrolysing)
VTASLPVRPPPDTAHDKILILDYGVQFHSEITHTVQGKVLLERFVLKAAGARPDWVMRDHVEEAVALIRRQVGGEEVILGLSGSVDSSVAAALIHRAIGYQLTCVFVDHGLLRLNEADLVMEMFVGHAGHSGDAETEALRHPMSRVHMLRSAIRGRLEAAASAGGASVPGAAGGLRGADKATTRASDRVHLLARAQLAAHDSSGSSWAEDGVE